MTIFIVPAARAFANALMTRKNTRMGATAFNAETNRLPSNAMNSLTPMRMSLPSTTAAGIRSASTTPITRPTMIRLIRLISVYLRAIVFRNINGLSLSV